ncbi:MAG TPA: LysR family transcriptional regulator [Acidimicrobiales bacterium]|jgi:DNA-binding transcriptional LysR family regulator|nr:LysR family transcriptional regulator [Acidimicrobiales bacterium]
MMDLVLMESLLAVAEEGTITAAAQRVNVSQSALSRRLQQLEAELGVSLLVRGRHGVELTVLGHQTVAHARSIMARYGELKRDLAERLGLLQGTVRIGGGATVTSFLFPPAIARFQSDHPGIRFYVKEAGSNEIAADVASGDIELGVVTLPIPAADLDVAELMVDDIVLVAGTDHPLMGRPLRAVDLRGQTFIAFEPGSAIRQIIDARLRRAGIEPDIVMELRSIPSILRMVATTNSLAFVSRLSLGTEPGVSPVRVRGLAISRMLGLASRHGFPLSPAASVFFQMLVEVPGATMRP